MCRRQSVPLSCRAEYQRLQPNPVALRCLRIVLRLHRVLSSLLNRLLRRAMLLELLHHVEPRSLHWRECSWAVRCTRPVVGRSRMHELLQRIQLRQHPSTNCLNTSAPSFHSSANIAANDSDSHTYSNRIASDAGTYTCPIADITSYATTNAITIPTGANFHSSPSAANNCSSTRNVWAVLRKLVFKEQLQHQGTICLHGWTC